MRGAMLAALVLLGLGGCTPIEAPQTSTGATSSGQTLARQMSAADRTACTAGGGRVERRGRLGAELCVQPFADAGKTCSDTSQCQGKCVGTAEQASLVGSVAGQCQADNRLFGCYSEIKGGKAVNAICVD